MANETRPDIAALLGPRFQLARSHHQLDVQRSIGLADSKRLLDAANQLQRAIENAGAQDPQLARQCLDAAAVIFLMQPRQQLVARAAYFERGATLLAAANPAAVRSNAEEKRRTQVEAALKAQPAFLVDLQKKEAESGFKKEGVDALINRARTSINEVIQVLNAR
jgi:hypothetical protein